MPESRANADGTAEALRTQIQIAAARYRLARLAAASQIIAWVVAATMWAVLAASFFTPLADWAVQIALAVMAAGAVFAVEIYRAQPDRRRLLVLIDAYGKLPDSALSAADWESAPTDAWREAQRAETLRLLGKIDWRQAWPVRWPRLLWLPLAASLLLLATIWNVQQNRVRAEKRADLTEAQANAPVAAGQLKPLEEVFKDWDEAQKIVPSPELAELLKQIQPMRDEMAAGKLTEKELFLKLNAVQARIQAAKDRIEAGSLEPMAQSLADAVKDLDGMSGLSAALQRKDFAAAREQAALAAEKYNTGAAKMPEGMNAQTSAAKLGDAAQKAANDAQASSALRQMQEALSKNAGTDGKQSGDSQEMGKGLGELKESLAAQAQRQAQSQGLGTQLAQLNAYKNGMGNGGSGTQLGLPQLSLAKSQQPGQGAGSAIDPNRFGNQTQIDASHEEMKITGTAGDGSSETKIESTNDPHLEQTAGSVSAATFSAYEKLSEQATEDENLPVSDRQMIKRYFEDIRPQAVPGSP